MKYVIVYHKKDKKSNQTEIRGRNGLIVYINHKTQLLLEKGKKLPKNMLTLEYRYGIIQLQTRYDTLQIGT